MSLAIRAARSTLLALAMLGGLVAAGGCAARDAPLLGSDIPTVPGLESTSARQLDRRGDELVSGVFSFHGRIDDEQRLFDRTAALFTGRGWTLVSRERGDRRIRGRFEKGDRVCDLVIAPNRIDPAMSVATILVELMPEPSPAP
jgi:hypothetical protein